MYIAHLHHALTPTISDKDKDGKFSLACKKCLVKLKEFKGLTDDEEEGYKVDGEGNDQGEEVATKIRMLTLVLLLSDFGSSFHVDFWLNGQLASSYNLKKLSCHLINYFAFILNCYLITYFNCVGSPLGYFVECMLVKMFAWYKSTYVKVVVGFSTDAVLWLPSCFQMCYLCLISIHVICNIFGIGISQMCTKNLYSPNIPKERLSKNGGG